MVKVKSDILIKASIEVVADFAANPDNASQWYVNIKSVDWKTPKPMILGSRVAFVAHFLGRKLAYTYEIVELKPRQKLVMRTAEGPFPMETTYTWEEIDKEITKMTLQNQGSPSGFSRIFSPIMGFMMGRANAKDLALLKKIIESKRD